MATRADTRSPALHVADGHDLIRVHGARENKFPETRPPYPLGGAQAQTRAHRCLHQAATEEGRSWAARRREVRWKARRKQSPELRRGRPQT